MMKTIGTMTWTMIGKTMTTTVMTGKVIVVRMLLKQVVWFRSM
ncbi:MAG: hypothetical protein ACFFCP_10370 [Promethearchaeota archaeon]